MRIRAVNWELSVRAIELSAVDGGRLLEVELWEGREIGNPPSRVAHS